MSKRAHKKRKRAKTARQRGRNTGAEQQKPSFTMETLEPRILLSATWVDADTDADHDGATEGNDIYTGDDSDNVADGLGGDDTLFGHDGDDTLAGGTGDDSLFGGDGEDALFGGDGADTLTGEDGDDTLSGGAGDDSLFGGEGDDTLSGGDGDDDFVGGQGSDMVDYSNASSGVDVNLTTGSATGQGSDTLDGVENVTGSSSADTLTGDSSSNLLSGGAGNDDIDGKAGDDILVGGAGDDNLTGGGGTDTVDYSAAAAGVQVDLDSGTATGADGNDTLFGIENVIGSNHDDELTGDQKANVLTGGSGNDLLQGDGGHDTLVGGDGSDQLFGGKGHDQLDGGAGNDMLDGGDGHDVITDGSGDDVIHAGDGHDTIHLYSGNDVVNAGDGNDTIVVHEGTAGDINTVNGGDGTNSLDLSHFSANQVDHVSNGDGSGSVNITLDEGGHFTVNYADIDNVILGSHANEAPIATDGSLTMSEDGTAAVTLTGTDPDSGDAVESFRIDTLPANGTLTNGGTPVSAGDTVTAQQVANGDLTFTPNAEFSGSDSFTFSANDGEVDSAQPATFTINVTPYDDAPTAEAGGNQTVDEGDTVTLDASGSSDPEGQGLTYTWTQTGGPSVTLSDANAAQPSFDAPEGASNTSLTFQVAVSDGTNTSYDTVTVDVNADDDAPTAEAGGNQTVDEGDTVTLDASGSSDPEGQGLTYTWTQTGGPSVSLSDASAAQPTFDAPEGASNTSLTFQVAVSDGTNTSYDTVTVNVNADDDAPTAEAGSNQTVDEGDSVTLDASSSSDPEGQGLTYTWTQTGGPSVSLSDANAAQPIFDAPEGASNTSLTFQVAVSDGTNTSYDTVTVNVNADDDAPTAEAGGNQTVDEGDTVTLDASGSSDPEGQGLTYTWTQTGGPSVSLSDASAAQPTFDAPEGASNTSLTFQVAVSDGTNTSYDTVTVDVNADDDAPTAEAGSNQTVDEGDSVTLDASGSSDPEGQVQQQPASGTESPQPGGSVTLDPEPSPDFNTPAADNVDQTPVEAAGPEGSERAPRAPRSDGTPPSTMPEGAGTHTEATSIPMGPDGNEQNPEDTQSDGATPSTAADNAGSRTAVTSSATSADPDLSDQELAQAMEWDGSERLQVLDPSGDFTLEQAAALTPESLAGETNVGRKKVQSTFQVENEFDLVFTPPDFAAPDDELPPGSADQLFAAETDFVVDPERVELEFTPANMMEGNEVNASRDGDDLPPTSQAAGFDRKSLDPDDQADRRGSQAGWGDSSQGMFARLWLAFRSLAGFGRGQRQDGDEDQNRVK